MVLYISTVAVTMGSARVLHSAENLSKKFPKIVLKMSVMLSFCIVVYLEKRIERAGECTKAKGTAFINLTPLMYELTHTVLYLTMRHTRLFLLGTVAEGCRSPVGMARNRRDGFFSGDTSST